MRIGDKCKNCGDLIWTDMSVPHCGFDMFGDGQLPNSLEMEPSSTRVECPKCGYVHEWTAYMGTESPAPKMERLMRDEVFLLSAYRSGAMADLAKGQVGRDFVFLVHENSRYYFWITTRRLNLAPLGKMFENMKATAVFRQLESAGRVELVMKGRM